MSKHDLPSGCVVREASLEDAGAIADLVNEVNVAEAGFPWTNEGEVHEGLISPRREAGDHVVMVGGDGSIVGYLNVWRDEPLTTIQHLAFVRPGLWGRGLSAWLLRDGEERSRDDVERARPEGIVHLRVARWATNTAAGSLFAALGYRYARTFHEMRIELDGAVAAPEVPDRIEVWTVDPERDARTVHGALVEAFEDHWGSNFPLAWAGRASLALMGAGFLTLWEAESAWAACGGSHGTEPYPSRESCMCSELYGSNSCPNCCSGYWTTCVSDFNDPAACATYCPTREVTSTTKSNCTTVARNVLARVRIPARARAARTPTGTIVVSTAITHRPARSTPGYMRKSAERRRHRVDAAHER